MPARAVPRPERRRASEPGDTCGSRPWRRSPPQPRRTRAGVCGLPWSKSSTIAIAVAVAYAACPEVGNEEPSRFDQVDPGGRPVDEKLDHVCGERRVMASAAANAISPRHRRARTSTRLIASRVRARHKPWPIALKMSAMCVRNGVSISRIDSAQRLSSASGPAGTSSAPTITRASNRLPPPIARRGWMKNSSPPVVRDPFRL